MTPRILTILLMVSVTLLSGCYYDVEEELYPANDNSCDTADVTYSLTVKPIINDNCIVCHSQASQQGSVVLETYNDIQVYASSGQLLGAIKHQPGYSPMPQGGAKLSDCNILKIEKWVLSGIPNN